MAEIDLKFMKMDRKTARSIGNKIDLKEAARLKKEGQKKAAAEKKAAAKKKKTK